MGGLVEVIGGTSDRNKEALPGTDGLSRGLFSRIIVDYDRTLDNGLQVSGNISHRLDQQSAAAPDVLSLSVGGGFGTITAGAAAAAPCALMPRIIAFVPGGANATWYTLFSGLSDVLPGQNVTFSEANYCGTSESISYQTRIYSPPPTDDESFFLTGSDPAWFRAPFPRSRPRTGCTGFG